MYALIKEDSPLPVAATVLHRYPHHWLIQIDAKLPPPHAARILPQVHRLCINGQRLSLQSGQFIRDQTPRHILCFAGPIAPNWLTALEQLSVICHFSCPPFGLCITLPEGLSTQTLQDVLHALVAMVPYRFELCSRALGQRSPRSHYPTDWVDVICFSTSDRDNILNILTAQGVTPSAVSTYKIRLDRHDIGDNLTALRQMHGVKLADPARPCDLTWAPLDDSLGIGAPDDHALVNISPLTGAGQIISVADTGLDHGINDDTLHDDFKGRVKTIINWPINPSWQGYAETLTADDGAADKNSGHGTHVAGLALGSGARSTHKYRGVAPEAQLVFQALEQYTHIRADKRHTLASGYYLNGRPLDLYELFERAHGEGARIHVNAWGDPASGQYTDDCYEVDRFLWHHPQALILFAAGNAGQDVNGDQMLDGGSLYAPASSKNVVAVGATEGPLSGIGYRGGWAGFDPNHQRFTHPTVRRDPVSGQPDKIAMISSTGPTRDGRIKPDVCAPGTNLPAPRSRATAAKGWGLASPMPHYMYLGGTSMATGVTGGFAALVRQAWQATLGRAPSGMALKALIIMGCLPVQPRNPHAEPDNGHTAGFGRIYLPHTLPSNDITLIDDANLVLRTGENHQWSITLASTGPLKAVLVWYDYPGEQLINDLDLRLECADGTVWLGNQHLSASAAPDRTNTVEMLNCPALRPGQHRLIIEGANIPMGPQRFALVVNQPSLAIAKQEDAPDATDSVLPQLPVEWIKGIGGTYDRRLNAAGIQTIDQLGTLSGAQLAQLLSASAGRTDRLLAGLTRLRHALTQPITVPESFNRSTSSLAAFLQAPRPPNTTASHWQAWQALTTVFDKDVLDKTTLSALLG